MQNLEKAIKILEFDKVLNMLASVSATEGAKKRALTLVPSSDYEVIMKRQTLTDDAKGMSEVKGAPSFGTMPDILNSVEKAEKNSVLSPREILDVASVLRSTRSLCEYIKTDIIKDCDLKRYFEKLVPNKPLEDKIYHDIISEDLIADDASPKLADIRRKIRYQTNRIRDILQSYTSSSENSKFLRDNVVTIRNGRYVVPVKVENRNDVKGLIHDTSGSGSTLFIEPIAVVEANNELRTLSIAEQNEIERILAEFSNEIALFGMQLNNNYYNITEIAFYFACSELAFKMRASKPVINQNKYLRISRARHPLLDKEKVVPIDISLGENYDMLVITGPNTGGKTVTLKTVGIFALMAQSGLQLPCDNAEICVFDGIYPDIGDEQSIEQSLSTFSGHMISVKDILENVTEKSLAIFDELGAGTDPVEGAALAQSILEKVLSKKCLCMATTHYAELKAFALNTKGVTNASCEFDVITLKPTYRLIIGSPGKSNAFLISQKLGITDDIIERAKQLTSEESREFESVIEKLEELRFLAEQEKEKAKKSREEYESFKAKAEKELNDKLSSAQKESEELKRRAQELITGARASADYIFSELEKIKKNSDNYAAKKREIREKIEEADEIYNPIEKIDENYVLPRELRVGDNVAFKNVGTLAVVIEKPDKNGNIVVKSGAVKTRTNIDKLVLIEEEIPKKQVVSSIKAKNTISASFSISLDVRGKNIEDAWIDIDKYLDEAIMHNVSSVTIVHGKGTGALRKGLWELFRKDKRIKKYRAGQFGEGDYGVTIIELKI